MFEYRVKFYDNGESRIVHGLLGGAETYVAAIKKLTDYFGDDLIEECSLTCISDNAHVLVYQPEVTSIKEMIDE